MERSNYKNVILHNQLHKERKSGIIIGGKGGGAETKYKFKNRQ
jgi:hypothetical protein